MTDLSELLERVRRCRKPDNALDIEIEIALFRPDEDFASVRANAAGTKVVYTRHDGRSQTHWAFDYTLDGHNRLDAMERLSALQSEAGK